jgi:hypothetical protein
VEYHFVAEAEGLVGAEAEVFVAFVPDEGAYMVKVGVMGRPEYGVAFAVAEEEDAACGFEDSAELGCEGAEIAGHDGEVGEAVEVFAFKLVLAGAVVFGFMGEGGIGEDKVDTVLLKGFTFF